MPRFCFGTPPYVDHGSAELKRFRASSDDAFKLATRLRGTSGIAKVYFLARGVDLPEKYTNLGMFGDGPESLCGRLPHWGAVITELANTISSGRVDLLHSAVGCCGGRPPAASTGLRHVRHGPSDVGARSKTYASALSKFSQASWCSVLQAEELSELNVNGLPRRGSSSLGLVEPFRVSSILASSIMMHFQKGLGFGGALQASIAAGSTDKLTAGGMSVSQLPMSARGRSVSSWLEESNAPRDGDVVLRQRGFSADDIGEDEANLARFVCARAYATRLSPGLHPGSEASGRLMFGTWPSLLAVSNRLAPGSCLETASAVEAVDAAYVVASHEKDGDLTAKQYNGACAIKQAAEDGEWGHVSFLLAAHSISRTDVFESTKLYRGLLIGVATASARGIGGGHSEKVSALRAHLLTLARVKSGDHALYDARFLEFVTSSTDDDLTFFGSLFEEAVAEIFEENQVVPYRLRGASDSLEHMRATSDPFRIIACLTGLRLGGQRGKLQVATADQSSAITSTACGGQPFLCAGASYNEPNELKVLESKNSLLRTRLASAHEEIALLKVREDVLRSAVATLQHRATDIGLLLNQAFSSTITNASGLQDLEEEFTEATLAYNSLVNTFNDANGGHVKIT